MARAIFKKVGDWVRASNAFQKLNKTLRPTFVAQVDKDGELILERLRGHIDAQDLGWVALSPISVRIKGSEKIWVDTGTIYNAMTVQKFTFSKSQFSVFVGVPEGVSHPGTSVSSATICMWLEEGTPRMPARPLFQPTFEEVERTIKSNWKQCMAGFMGSL